jgi:hypothetical protein
MLRGLESRDTMGFKLTQPTGKQLPNPTKFPLKRILQVIDDNTAPSTSGTRLNTKLSEIDGRVWRYETARSGTNGAAVRGYVESEYRPLDWVEVRALRDEAISAVELLTAERERQSMVNQMRSVGQNYGTVPSGDEGTRRSGDSYEESEDEDAVTLYNLA